MIHALQAMQYLGAAASISRGFGGLGDTSFDYVAERSEFVWEGYLTLGDGSNQSVPISAEVTDQIEGALYSQGAFYSVSVINTSNFFGSFSGQLIQIRVVVASDFMHVDDVCRLISGSIYNGTGINIQHLKDSTIVTSGNFPIIATQAKCYVSYVPPGASIPAGNQPAQGGAGLTPDQRGAGLPPDQRNANAPKCPYPTSMFCECGYEFSLLDLGCVQIGSPDTAANKLAKSFGVTPTSAAVFGAFVALIGVIAIGKTAK